MVIYFNTKIFMCLNVDTENYSDNAGLLVKIKILNSDSATQINTSHKETDQQQ